MYKTLVAILVSILSAPIYADIFCPPVSEIHCVGSHCTLGPAVQNNWEIYAVAGIPKDLQFYLAEFAFTPSPANCVYGSSEGFGSGVTLISKGYYAADVKSPYSAWDKLTTYSWRCGTGSGPMSLNKCPILDN